MNFFMKKLKYIYIALFVCFSLIAKGQYVLNEADKQFELYHFHKAKQLYEQAFKKKETLYAAKQLALTSLKNKEYEDAEKWYAKALTFPKADTELILAYAKALQYNAKYEEAKEAYEDYIKKSGKVSKANQSLWSASCDSSLVWLAHPKEVKIENLKALNSGKTDYGVVKYNDGLVFVSDRGIGIDSSVKAKKGILRFDTGTYPNKSYYGWTGKNYLRLLYADKDNNITAFPLNTSSEYHLGTPSFSKDGKEVLFTITRLDKDLKFDKTKFKLGTVKVEIYSSKLQNDGTWSQPVPFPYNNVNSYSVGDPFLAEDGQVLYFVSDMPGGKGGMDIYKTYRKGDSWSKPENVKELNTEGHERTPYFLSADTLFFSSDGRVGMGDLDIFRAVNKSGKWDIVNLGHPYNTPQDDFAFSIEREEKGWKGYLSSNRSNGEGADDIYVFSELIKVIVPESIFIEGIVYDKKTRKPITNAYVKFTDATGKELNVLTDGTGYYKFQMEANQNYHLKAQKTLFNDKDTAFVSANKSIQQDFYLAMYQKGRGFRIDNIYYDFDKDNIRPDAALELDKLVAVLNEYPEINIELGSHTDSRGSDAYNLNLSQRRARSAVAYIIKQGIGQNRITAKGYGETQHVNKCKNGVQCTDEEHQMNRRTEVKIVN